jgi:hypothetical protein
VKFEAGAVGGSMATRWLLFRYGSRGKRSFRVLESIPCFFPSLYLLVIINPSTQLRIRRWPLLRKPFFFSLTSSFRGALFMNPFHTSHYLRLKKCGSRTYKW